MFLLKVGKHLGYLILALMSISVIADEAVWIDVRTPAEFETGHIAGAILIPHDQIRDRIVAAVPDKTAPVYLYCRSGGRADIALSEMQALGYQSVVNVGGYQDALDFLEQHPQGQATPAGVQ